MNLILEELVYAATVKWYKEVNNHWIKNNAKGGVPKKWSFYPAS